MPVYGRSFSLINKGVDWLTINVAYIKAKEIKNRGGKAGYFDNTYGKSNWKFFYVVQNKPATDEEIIHVLTQAFELYYTTEKDLVDTWIWEIQNSGLYSRNEENTIDLIFKTELELISTAFLNFYTSLNEEIDPVASRDIMLFFGKNKLLLHDIPLLQDDIVLQSKQKVPWLKNSIKGFFTQNLVVQVKSSVIEDEPTIGLFLRKDLKLGKGKKGAQLSHAAVTLLFQPQIRTNLHDKWFLSKDKIKIWQIQGLKELLEIKKVCHKNKINIALINDAGHTQVDPGTSTCIGVGPLPKIWLEILAEEIDANELI